MSSKKFYLIDGATLLCNKGNQPTELKVSSQNFRTNEGKPYATEKDNIPNQNILPFGVCSITQKKCVPSTQPWNKMPRATIEDKKRLYESSECKCAIGGVIQVKHPGQKFVGEAEGEDEVSDRKNEIEKGGFYPRLILHKLSNTDADVHEHSGVDKVRFFYLDDNEYYGCFETEAIKIETNGYKFIKAKDAIAANNVSISVHVG